MTTATLRQSLPIRMLPRLPIGGWFFVGWLFVFTLAPFLIILGMSFFSTSEIGEVQFRWTIANYDRCFQWLYAKVLWKTFLMASFATLGCLILGFPVAYYLARSKGVRRQIGLVLLFIPFWTCFILRVYGLVSVLGTNGLLNHFLIETGIVNEPVRILYTRWGVFLGLIYNYLPFLVVPVFSSLEKLDRSLLEASWDLGATRFQSFRKVILPNVKEGIAVGCLFVFIPMLGEYVIPDLLGGAKEVFLGNVMVSQFFTLQDWPFGSALAGLLSMVLLLTLFVSRRWSK
jgi:spermidine/putrescine transport system permease protein